MPSGCLVTGLKVYPKWCPYLLLRRNFFKRRINLATPLIWYALSLMFLLLHTWWGFKTVPTSCFLDSRVFCKWSAPSSFLLGGNKKQGWGFTSNVFQLKSPATRGSSQLCFLPQAFDIVGAFQCVAGLLTRESQHCPALPHWIERNVPASHWTWNKLLLPQASQLFCCLFNSKVMTISVWNGLCCSLRLWVTLC